MALKILSKPLFYTFENLNDCNTSSYAFLSTLNVPFASSFERIGHPFYLR